MSQKCATLCLECSADVLTAQGIRQVCCALHCITSHAFGGTRRHMLLKAHDIRRTAPRLCTVAC